jgi:peptide-methionine (S)-S-oxide reductase
LILNSIITLGGGCFWCTQAVFKAVPGVLDTEVGYCNGQIQEPKYEAVCRGDTGHNEVTQVRFDASIVSLEALLNLFFATHDPTSLNRQGADQGTQYRSGIYTHANEQTLTAQSAVEKMQGAFNQPIVTEITPRHNYWPAEAYHQDYFSKHPDQGYCAMVIAPKVKKLPGIFATLFLKTI